MRDFLRYDFAVLDFLNADEIARGLSPLAPERAQLEAGRIMLERVSAIHRRKARFRNGNYT
ncbi:MAG: hypothetical protein WDN28_18535 [Chthoniobacter sp.]